MEFTFESLEHWNLMFNGLFIDCSTWLQRHFSNGIQKFIPHMYNLTPALVAATMALHQRICAVFRSTASKFLYSFTLRDMSAVFKGRRQPAT